MKRLGSSESPAGFMTICPSTTEEKSPRNNSIYNREFQSMFEGLDEEGCIEESGHVPEKKRRLGVEQVKALEKNFEVENKLEPDRKLKLAQELGLQPRQVAVWFQNRRARWKTKQLERDYGALKANYESLKLNYETLHHDNEALLKEIRELKSKLQEDSTTTTKSNNSFTLEETKLVLDEKDNNTKLIDQTKSPFDETKDFDYKILENGLRAASFLDIKDGSSDSDSSAILNEENCKSLQSNPPLVMSPKSSSLDFNHCPSSMSECFQFQKIYQSQQFPKIEEHNFFSADEACNLFTDEWYSADQWS